MIATVDPDLRAASGSKRLDPFRSCHFLAPIVSVLFAWKCIRRQDRTWDNSQTAVIKTGGHVTWVGKAPEG
jgi:hypothetical protein